MGSAAGRTRGARARWAWAALAGLAATVAGPTLVTATATAVPARPAHTASTASTAATKPHATVQRSCADPAPGQFACFAEKLVATASGATTSSASPGGLNPADIQSAYKLPGSTAGTGRTVAIVDAYDLPTAESDLAVYRSQFGLPACTTANGCFKKISQSGSTTSLPTANASWGEEITLDLDMVSATCPLCNILLVEATSASTSNLGTAVNQAVSQGAVAVSNSYGGSDSSSDSFYDTNYYKHPGVAITASTGDDGYGVEYPAASPWVVAVGGTSLTKDSSARGWTESAWSGAGSGCSANESKPSFQTDTGCAKRALADVSAVANPNTGVSVYDTYGNGNAGWQVYGGTSASSPIVASVYAMANRPTAGTYANAYPYAKASSLFDVTSGSNGSCSGSYLCTAGVGYDGPTGLGTPNGTAAFGPVIATAPGAPTAVSATAGNAQATVSWTAPSSDGGSAITGYVVHAYAGGSPVTTASFGATATGGTVTGLTNGTAYTFTVAAVNAVGAGAESSPSNAVTPVVPATVPGAPTIGSVTAASGQAIVHWTAPASDGGSAITGYTVTPSLNGTPQAAVPFASTATSQTITGLANGGSYTFTVAATNGVGTGAASAASTAVVVGAPAAPGAPNPVSGNASVKLSWSAPATNGAAITGYTITPYVAGVAQAPQSFTSASTTETVTGLANGTSYTFTVAATNGRGTGPASAPSAAIASGLPSSAGFLSGTSGNASFKAAWWAPSGNGSAITGYTITPYLNGVALAPQVFTTNANNDVVTGLTNGQTYTFKVAATNAVGTGPQSSMSPAILVGLPGTASFARSTSGNGSATVTWWAPSGNGSAITGYVITPYLNGVAQAAQSFNTAANSDVVTGLTNGQTYTFAIVAVNGVGAGPASTPSASVLVGLPATPAFVAGTSGDSSVKVSWWAPSGNGSAITGYTITPYLNGVALAPQVFTTNASNDVVTGLTNGQTYTFKVAATNAVGTGPQSSMTTGVLVGLPAAPAFLKVTALANSAKVSWWAPSGNGSPVTGYQITPYLNGVAQPTQVFTTNANNDVVTGLTNGQTYTFKVAAVNAVGVGAVGSVTATI